MVGGIGYSNYNTYRSLYTNQLNSAKALSKLSSGYRINSAADDAAGIAISEGMRGQIRGLSMASQNTQNGVSLIQTAEGALDTNSSILTRMRELAVQASNGTYSDEDRALLNKEFQNLKSEVDRISQSTHYNGINLIDGSLGGKKGYSGASELGVSGVSTSADLDGTAKFNISLENGVYSVTAQIGGETITNQLDASQTSTTFTLAGGETVTMDYNFDSLKEGVIQNVGLQQGGGNLSNAVSSNVDGGLTFQIGANGAQDQRVSLYVGDMSAAALGIANLDISDIAGANEAISALDNATNINSSQRGSLGAMQNRLEHTLNNLGVTQENAVASESTIRDADMAKSIMDYMQNSILTQASQAMMAHSMNLSRQNMLALLMR